MKILVVGNPVSGSGRGRGLMEKAARLLEDAKNEVTVVSTGKRGDARAAAGEVPADKVVCVGGDGTVNEVVSGLPDRATPVAVVPAGTANVLVRELGLPRNVEDVCAAVCGGTERRLDSCVTGEGRFLLSSGAGFDASVVHRLAAARRGTSSYLAYAGPVMKSLIHYDPVALSVEVDGETVCEDASFCVVANVKSYIGRWEMLPGADPADGYMDVLAFRRTGRLSLLGFGLSFAFQRHTLRKDVCRVRGRRVRVSSPDDARVPVHMDGDAAGHVPLDAAIDAGSVRIVVPGRESS